MDSTKKISIDFGPETLFKSCDHCREAEPGPGVMEFSQGVIAYFSALMHETGDGDLVIQRRGNAVEAILTLFGADDSEVEANDDVSAAQAQTSPRKDGPWSGAQVAAAQSADPFFYGDGGDAKRAPLTAEETTRRAVALDDLQRMTQEWEADTMARMRKFVAEHEAAAPEKPAVDAAPDGGEYSIVDAIERLEGTPPPARDAALDMGVIPHEAALVEEINARFGPHDSAGAEPFDVPAGTPGASPFAKLAPEQEPQDGPNAAPLPDTAAASETGFPASPAASGGDAEDEMASDVEDLSGCRWVNPAEMASDPAADREALARVPPAMHRGAPCWHGIAGSQSVEAGGRFHAIDESAPIKD